MALTTDQKEFFQEYGYLPYTQVLSDNELEALRQRSEDIAEDRTTHVPSRYIQLEAAFRDDATPRIDTVRKMTQLCYFDDLFQAVAKKPEIVDAIEDLLGPNIKFYTDQLMMKPRYNGTVTDWHQDSPAWPFFVPQDHVSCWVALDDATVENGCMTVIPGSHKWGPVTREYKQQFLDDPEIAKPTPVELKGRTLHVPPRSQLPPHRREPRHQIGVADWRYTISTPRRNISALKMRNHASAPNARCHEENSVSCTSEEKSSPDGSNPFFHHISAFSLFAMV